MITSYETSGKELVMLVLIGGFFHSHRELYLVVLFSTARHVESVEPGCILYITAGFYTINDEKHSKINLPSRQTTPSNVKTPIQAQHTFHDIISGG